MDTPLPTAPSTSAHPRSWENSGALTLSSLPSLLRISSLRKKLKALCVLFIFFGCLHIDRALRFKKNTSGIFTYIHIYILHRQQQLTLRGIKHLSLSLYTLNTIHLLFTKIIHNEEFFHVFFKTYTQYKNVFQIFHKFLLTDYSDVVFSRRSLKRPAIVFNHHAGGILPTSSAVPSLGGPLSSVSTIGIFI